MSVIDKEKKHKSVSSALYVFVISTAAYLTQILILWLTISNIYGKFIVGNSTLADISFIDTLLLFMSFSIIVDKIGSKFRK